MSRTLYLDCFSGISGDMFLGALLDIGASPERIRQGLSALGLDAEFDLVMEKTARQGITGTRFDVSVHHEKHDHDHDHHHDHDHDHEHSHEHDHAPSQEVDYPHQPHGRTYSQIAQLIDQSALKPSVKDHAQAVFAVIAEAEAAVHGVTIADVHFHEVGAIDSIVDIVGAALALDDLGIDELACSPLVDGSGTIRCQHGIIPVPVPAVARMLKGTQIPFRTSDCPTELITPTGMAIVKALSRSFGSMPSMHVTAIGYGFGQRDIGRLNALRVFLGETIATGSLIDPESVVLLECQIDNSTGEALGHAADCLMQAGALDVCLIPVFMKKFRPATLVQIVAKPALEQKLVEILFRETGTIGVRRQTVERYTMSRDWATVTVADHPTKVKIVRFGSLTKAYPEYADAVALAERTGISYPTACEQIMAAFREQQS